MPPPMPYLRMEDLVAGSLDAAATPKPPTSTTIVVEHAAQQQQQQQQQRPHTARTRGRHGGSAHRRLPPGSMHDPVVQEEYFQLWAVLATSVEDRGEAKFVHPLTGQLPAAAAHGAAPSAPPG